MVVVIFPRPKPTIEKTGCREKLVRCLSWMSLDAARSAPAPQSTGKKGGRVQPANMSRSWPRSLLIRQSAARSKRHAPGGGSVVCGRHLRKRFSSQSGAGRGCCHLRRLLQPEAHRNGKGHRPAARRRRKRRGAMDHGLDFLVEACHAAAAHECDRGHPAAGIEAGGKVGG